MTNTSYEHRLEYQNRANACENSVSRGTEESTSSQLLIYDILNKFMAGKLLLVEA